MHKPYIPPEPQPPEPSDKEITVSRIITSVRDRIQYWPGGNGQYDWEVEEDEQFPEEPRLGKCISIRKIQENLPPNITLEDVYFTASFADDYLIVEARYSEKIKLYDEQMKNYERCHKIWLDNKPYYDRDLDRYEKHLKEELAALSSSNPAK